MLDTASEAALDETVPRPKKRQIIIPSFATQKDRLMGIRSLLMQGDNDRALEELNVLLDRYHGSWRCGDGAAAWG